MNKFNKNILKLALILAIFAPLVSISTTNATHNNIDISITVSSMLLKNNGENGNVWIWGRLSTFAITSCPSSAAEYEANWTPLVYADESIYTPIVTFDFSALTWSGSLPSSSFKFVYGLLCAIDDSNPDELWRGRFEIYGTGSGSISSPTPGNIAYDHNIGLRTYSAYSIYQCLSGTSLCWYEYNAINAYTVQTGGPPPPPPCQPGVPC